MEWIPPYITGSSAWGSMEENGHDGNYDQMNSISDLILVSV